MPTTVNEWLDFITTLHDAPIDLSLGRIQSIAKERGFTHFPCPVITVAGTNGKGSCVRVLERIYLAAGYRVGACYSPHFHRFNERIHIQGEEIDDDRLMAAFYSVEAYRQDRPLTFFEYTALATFQVFQQESLEVIILEVGLGGRLDAMNVVEPDVAIVTSVGLDHRDRLGDDRDAIGFEKAGIYRANKPAICGDEAPPQSLLAQAEAIGATLFTMNNAFSYVVHADSWDWRGMRSSYQGLPRPHLKCQNAACSLMAVEALQSSLVTHEENVKNGLKNTGLSGRFEVFSSPVLGVLDVAHNPDSAHWLAEQLAAHHYPAKKIAVVGMLEEKDIVGTLAPLLPHIDQWYVAKLDTELSADPEDIVVYLRASGVEGCYTFDAVDKAFDRARRACCHADDRVIVFGSFYTVAAVKALFRLRCPVGASAE